MVIFSRANAFLLANSSYRANGVNNNGPVISNSRPMTVSIIRRHNRLTVCLKVRKHSNSENECRS